MQFRVRGGDVKDILRAFSKNLPFNKDLMHLLNQPFKIEQQVDTKIDNTQKPKKTKPKKEKVPFNPKRYPSFFSLKTGKGNNFLAIPEGSEKIIQLASDVEDNNFDRSDDPGELKISLLHYNCNRFRGGDIPGIVERPDKLLDIRKSSPRDGTIRVGFGATNELRVRDEIGIDATLVGHREFETRFWLKVVEPQQKPKEVKKPVKEEEPPIGLPQYELVYQNHPAEYPDAMTWDRLEGLNIDMNWDIVMHPYVEGEGQLEIVLLI